MAGAADARSGFGYTYLPNTYPPEEVDAQKGYPCATERDSSKSLAFVMDGQGSMPTVYRHPPGSLLTFYVDPDKLSRVNHLRLRTGMIMASENWNWYNIGVTFKEVMDKTKAALQVVYNPYLDSATYATAPFPNDHDQTLIVGPRSFSARYIDYIANVLTHELGHVLGLRHTNWKCDGESQGFYYPSDQLDQTSIMNNKLAYDLSLLVVSRKDVAHVKKLYRLGQGVHRHPQTHRRFRIVDVLFKTNKRNRRKDYYLTSRHNKGYLSNSDSEEDW